MSKIWTSTFKDDPENTAGFGYLYNELKTLKQYVVPALELLAQDSVGNYPGEGADMEDLQLRTDLVDDSTIELLSNQLRIKGVGSTQIPDSGVGASKLGADASYASAQTRYLSIPPIIVRDGYDRMVTVDGTYYDFDLYISDFYRYAFPLPLDAEIKGVTMYYTGNANAYIYAVEGNNTHLVLSSSEASGDEGTGMVEVDYATGAEDRYFYFQVYAGATLGHFRGASIRYEIQKIGPC